MSTALLVSTYTPQSIAWDVAGALWAWLSCLLFVAVAGGVVAGAMIAAAIFWAILLQLAAAGCVIALFAYVTYPKAKARQ